MIGRTFVLEGERSDWVGGSERENEGQPFRSVTDLACRNISVSIGGSCAASRFARRIHLFGGADRGSLLGERPRRDDSRS